MRSVLRILDANANRAREALRVMEEAARFLLDDAALSRELKTLRHELAERLRVIPSLELHRDPPGDVGTTIHTASERGRQGAAEVAVAAGKRLTEALRAIEEYGKTLGDDALPAQIEAMRYRAYELERRLHASLGAGVARQWRLSLLLTESLCTHKPWRAVLGEALDVGVDCVQVREKQMEAAELLARCREAVALCRGRATVIVNDRVDVALAAGADGVHLGQADLPCAEARRLVGRRLLIGVSTSAIEEARRAKHDGADYCGVGPMFTTTTKHKDVIVGPEYLRAYLAWGGLPHLAIGGIKAANVGELVEAGVRGVAVSSEVCGAAEPGRAAAELLRRLPEPSDAVA